MKVALLTFGILLAGSACGDHTGPGGARIEGRVVRWPTEPACVADGLCEAPFAADFTVERNNRRVAGFTTLSDGRFAITLLPGDYQVVAAPEAPVLERTVTLTVPSDGGSGIVLRYDTGIR